MGAKASSFLAFVFLLIGIAMLSWPTVRDLLPNQSPTPSPENMTYDSQTGLAQTPATEKTLSTPPPLRASTGGQANELSINGVYIATNDQRAKNGVKSLQLNTTLNKAAHNKLQDMFALQYFEHISPQGKGPADVVEAAGYNYIKVGENLALGNFDGDSALVQAWMDSSGHRANIVAPGYTEIGVAVGKGTFEGKQTWLAVQTFGTPTNVCASVDTELRTSIESKQLVAQTMQNQLVEKDTELEEKFFALEELADEIKSLSQQGQSKVEQGNSKITEGNRIYEETGSKESAQPYWDAGQQLQKEGEALLAQAQAKQKDQLPAQENKLKELQQSYNQDVDQYNKTNQELLPLIDAYNNQVKIFNSCLANYS